MATAELGIRVRTDNVRQGTARLDELSQSAQRAERSTDQLSTTTETLSTTSGQAGRSMASMATGVNSSSRRLGQATSASRNFNLAIQNSSYQVGDFAVQMASGGSATRALAQQLPQLLGGFGVVGAAMGAVVAVGGALVPVLMNSGEESKSLSVSLEDLSDSLNSYKDAVNAAAQPTEDLYETYGEFADRAREVLNIQREIERFSFAKASDDAVSALTREFGSMDEAFTSMEEFRKGVETIQNTTLSGTNPQAGMEVDSINKKIAALQDLSSEYDLTIKQTISLNRAISELDSASGARETADSLAQMSDLYTEVLGGVSNMNAEQRALLENMNETELAARDFASSVESADEKVRNASNNSEELASRTLEIASAFASATAEVEYLTAVDIASGIDDAAESAERFAQQLQIALDFAQALPGTPVTQRDIAQGQRAFIGDQAQSTLDIGTSFAKSMGPAVTGENIAGNRLSYDVPSDSSSGGGGSSGSSVMSEAEREAERERQRLERESERVFDQTRTAAEEYSIEMEKLNRLRREGLITAETMSRAETDLAERFSEVSYAAQDMHRATGDAFASIVTGASSASEAMSGMLDQFAQMAARSAFSGLVGSEAFGGSIFGSIFGGLDGARASGGPVRSGGSYLVGEKGPEIFQPRQSGDVIPNGRTGGSGGSSKVEISLSPDVEARILQQSGEQAIRITEQGMQSFDDALPDRMAEINQDPARRN